jgi:hypothetical protein
VPASQPRLTLSPIGLDIVLAASQVPHGIRLTDLATVIGSPVSSVQAALRILIANGLIRRQAGASPRYGLAARHPACEQLAALATVLPEPEHAIAIILRANPCVAFAAADAGGFIVAVDGEPDAETTTRLDRHLGLVQETRERIPTIVRIPADEFGRLIAVDLELRRRVDGCVILKGGVPRSPHRPGVLRPAGQPRG